jgi:hypothetical protein
MSSPPTCLSACCAHGCAPHPAINGLPSVLRFHMQYVKRSYCTFAPTIYSIAQRESPLPLTRPHRLPSSDSTYLSCVLSRLSVVFPTVFRFSRVFRPLHGSTTLSTVRCLSVGTFYRAIPKSPILRVFKPHALLLPLSRRTPTPCVRSFSTVFH